MKIKRDNKKSASTSSPKDVNTQNNSTSIVSKSKKKVNLSIESKVRTLAIKCYDEQLPNGEKKLIENVMAMDKDKYAVYMIKHDKDEVTDGVWAVATEKPHYHIIFKMLNSKNNIRVSAILNKLGIVFREPEDTSLLEHHAIETCSNFENYLMYLTHETAEAQRDNKYQYDVDELWSNGYMDDYEAIRNKYVSYSKGKVDDDFMEQLDKEAYQAGYDLNEWKDWYQALPYKVRKDANIKVLQKSFDYGSQQRVTNTKDNQVTRLCVYIQGPHNLGKSYAIKKAMEGKKTIDISSGGSGKYDRLTNATDCIIIDDDEAPRNILNLADNYMTQLYRRNNNNPYWCGQYVFVTSNVSFEKWIQSGLEILTTSEKFYAIRSRFYICKVEQVGGFPTLTVLSRSIRGTAEEIKWREEEFERISAIINGSIQEYDRKKKKL